MKGANTANPTPTYGTKGTAATGNNQVEGVFQFNTVTKLVYTYLVELV
jgi:hypothetical protein